MTIPWQGQNQLDTGSTGMLWIDCCSGYLMPLHATSCVPSEEQGFHACSNPLCFSARSSDGCIIISRNSPIAKSKCSMASPRSSG